MTRCTVFRDREELKQCAAIMRGLGTKYGMHDDETLVLRDVADLLDVFAVQGGIAFPRTVEDSQ